MQQVVNREKAWLFRSAVVLSFSVAVFYFVVMNKIIEAKVLKSVSLVPLISHIDQNLL